MSRYHNPNRDEAGNRIAKEGEYLVTWTIDAFEAGSPEAAAWQARIAQTRPGTTATVFTVKNKATGVETVVELGRQEGTGI